jgi:hypothetical protein
MGNSLAGPDCFACECIYHDQGKVDFKMMRPKKNNQLEALYKIVQDLNNRLCKEETKLEAYKAQHKDLSLLTSILIAEKTSLMQENDQLRTMHHLLSSAQLSVYETQV